MSEPVIQIELTPQTRAFAARMQTMPQRFCRAIGRGIDSGNQLAITDISARRMTGRGPYPVAEGKLGVVTNRLRSSLRHSESVVEGNTITGSIGSNVIYAGVHEFGAVISRTTKDGSVRLRTDRQGNLLRQGAHLAQFAKKTHKLAREVKYRGGKNYTIRIPARAPIGHGIADNAQTYDREIGFALRAEWETTGLS